MSTDALPDAEIAVARDALLPLQRAGVGRRTFLQLAGFGAAAAVLPACSRAPDRHVVPRLDQGGEPVGARYRIATTCGGCEARCGVLATCRDGRPLKLEGNPEHALSRGGLCAVGQAELLGLYDGRRADGPQVRGRTVTWDEADAVVTQALREGGAGVRLLTRTVTSPSTRAWIDRFVRATGGRHVEVDVPSYSAALAVHEELFGVRAVPQIRLASVRVVAAFDADFLGTWGSPVAFARDWAESRDPDAPTPRFARHVQVESHLTLSGSRADIRIEVAPHELRAALAALCAALAGHASRPAPTGTAALAPGVGARLHKLAAALWAARGASAVLCGADDAPAQALCAWANHLLGNYGATVDLARPALHARGDDAALAQLLDDLGEGRVSVLIIDGVDLAASLPDARGVTAALKRAALCVSTSALEDDTRALAHVVVPAPHALECWDDAEPVVGHVSLAQPTVPALRAGRSLRASLAAWLGARGDDFALVREHWSAELHALSGTGAPFDVWFDAVARTGYVHLPRRAAQEPRPFDAAAFERFVNAPATPVPTSDTLTLVAYDSVALRDGRHAQNPWLQELPDPLTKVVWDNVACLAPATAARLGVRPGDVVRLAAADGSSVDLPALAQPGTHPDVVAVARGYGRRGTSRFAGIGPRWIESRPTPGADGVVGARVERIPPGPVHVVATGRATEIATTQDHHRMELPTHLAPRGGAVRDVARAVALAEIVAKGGGAPPHHAPPGAELWPADHAPRGVRWGLTIDLSACIGCSACAVACQAENCVPVVGRDEVRRHREMTWLRIDRYFSGDGDDLSVEHQPLMCQHCAHAPCETVCPVLATVHSEDGLNQQVYNRCVGTRYCANNCPYKVRRFNWFDYAPDDDLRRLALNPDVTVRSRGVMEKCTLCVQRIAEARIVARGAGGAAPADGAVRTACEESCPTQAIRFGNVEDPGSAVARIARSDRAYVVLGELNVQPGVTYLSRVRDTEPQGGGARDD